MSQLFCRVAALSVATLLCSACFTQVRLPDATPDGDGEVTDARTADAFDGGAPSDVRDVPNVQDADDAPDAVVSVMDAIDAGDDSDAPTVVDVPNPQDTFDVPNAADVPCSDGAILVCNGVCTDITTNLNHCGACGNVCGAVANGQPTCAAGACRVRGCAAGFFDCDRMFATGCEVNAATDINNCGACGTVCSAANGTPNCVASSCGVASCNAGFGNCDMMAANGCETNTNTNVNHCGACGTVCSFPNAQPSCAAGLCALSMCNAGFGNCDANAANGCERALTTDVTNCGACNNVCPGDPNGSPSCVASACTLQCNMGFQLFAGRCVSSPPPRQIAPISLGDVTQTAVNLSWILPAGYDGSVVELCRDRACTMVIETLRVGGRVTTARSSGGDPLLRTTVFWRVRGYVGMNDSPTTSPTWLFHTPNAIAGMGSNFSFHSRSDFNGDGFDDLAVGSENGARGDGMRTGIVSIFHGRAANLSTVPTQVLEGAAAGDAFGHSVSAGADLNGDGFGDLIVGAHNSDTMGNTDTGSVSVYLGSAMGLVDPPVRVITGTRAGQHMGWSLAGAGDVNRDGYGDFVVTSWDSTVMGAADAGSIGIFHGNAAGVGAAAARTISGTNPGDAFGFSVAAAGDINGDGYNDIVIGAYHSDPSGITNAGAAFVYQGTPTGILAFPDTVIPGLASFDEFGSTVFSPGDLNGDGFSDLALTARSADGGGRVDSGSVRVFLGGMAGLGAAPLASQTLVGALANDRFGTALAGGVDLDGDGYSDLIVGAPHPEVANRVGPGTVRWFRGDRLGSGTAPTVTLTGLLVDDSFGATLMVGDYNGNGIGDLAVGAPLADPALRPDGGNVGIYYGIFTGVIPLNPNVLILGAGPQDLFGTSLAWLLVPNRPTRFTRFAASMSQWRPRTAPVVLIDG